jgi:hypothetical protein
VSAVSVADSLTRTCEVECDDDHDTQNGDGCSSSCKDDSVIE